MPLPVPIVTPPPVAPLRSTVNVSAPSSMLSSLMTTSNVCATVPGPNESVPLAGAKSTPLVALPPVVVYATLVATETA